MDALEDPTITLVQRKSFKTILRIIVLLALAIFGMLPLILIFFGGVSVQLNAALLIVLTAVACVLGQAIEDRIEVLLVIIFAYVAIVCGFLQIQLQMGAGQA